jgi:hypothetical protein
MYDSFKRNRALRNIRFGIERRLCRAHLSSLTTYMAVQKLRQALSYLSCGRTLRVLRLGLMVRLAM